MTSDGETTMPLALIETPVGVLDTKQGADVIKSGPASTKRHEERNVHLESIIAFGRWSLAQA